MKEFLDNYGDIIIASIGTLIVISATMALFSSGGFMGDIIVSALDKAV